MGAQVSKSHYFNNYDNKKRIMSYWYQIREVMNCDPNTVLEIGIGNGFVSSYLENRGYDVTTVDIDEDLNPDVIEDVRN
ncbi:MAG: hypothetical protein ACLFM9_03990 [Candidatus Aenigmatarchaeota archaeon]